MEKLNRNRWIMQVSTHLTVFHSEYVIVKGDTEEEAKQNAMDSFQEIVDNIYDGGAEIAGTIFIDDEPYWAAGVGLV